ncbi:MAG: UDP-N-acetylglucosamine 4,6-dehydratase (inverting) [Chloroflexi bacterium]|nr:UDP-N-acetylglucosamine 4,6-dehydratase (inverting) [Chloroflexota bacterium]
MDWADQVVLVSGGTGTFGTRLVEVMLRDFHPRKLVIYSRDELKQYDMRTRGYVHETLHYVIGDVRDVDRLKQAFGGVDIVFHAAALKQILACEDNPMEAVLTNVMGARNVIEAALYAGVKRVINISSDKAVNPVNLYGATKMVADKLFIRANVNSSHRQARFSCVRYGNVVGSRGSVIPFFVRQRETGELPITDSRMTRFWITSEQGVRFAVRCVEQMQGGEIFIPKIPSMSVIDLANAIAPDAKLKVVGIRRGEKLHEVLLSEDEARSTVELDDMFVVQPQDESWFEQGWTQQGKPLPDGFRYTSDTNPNWLGTDQIRELVAPFEAASLEKTTY